MMILVYGGSGSGKSAFAEKKITELNKSGIPLYYLATMQVYDAEDEERIKRHRMQRAGKGFTTIEQPKDLGNIALELREAKSDILLECMSNVVANEMFSDAISDPSIYDKKVSEEKSFDKYEGVFNKIKDEIIKLKDSCNNLIIVSNNVFEDGNIYDDETMKYIKTLGDINVFLAEISDEVWEVVAGIPVRIK
ncbi:MAG: bifunctional adenosylcobinamide kinase/adenosylcobinamide-phosphate guanylyltransferase [Lachnospiraceae bacterium]|nr:bifunctional adenosylcobinamide kinase/adenosylcobinamide-phosphate guanylyltransferase [Lachnospiraceae bacterium]